MVAITASISLAVIFFLRRLGGTNPAITKAQRVTIHTRKGPVKGVVGSVAPHLMRTETGAPKVPKIHEVFVDIGAVFNVEDPVLIQNPFGNERFFPRPDDSGNPVFLNPGATDSVEDDTIVAIPVGDPIPDGFIAQGQTSAAFEEVFLGDTPSPRISVGVGVNWNSPFGPFRIDFAYALRKEPGDDTKTLSFNVGTQF